MLVSTFLIDRLKNAGVKHVFGLPGDYVLDFYKELWDEEDIEVINCTDENHAGFAADAYARVNGIGCVVVTYNVGAAKIINAVQCAYAERSPLIVISGTPGMNERKEGMLLHHMVSNFNSQQNMFDYITCESELLDNPVTAGYRIDKAMEALKHYKRPIYLELPRDVAKKSITYNVYEQGTPKAPKSDPENLDEALEEVRNWISEARNPAILAGVELHRYGLGEKLIKFAEKFNIPVATTLLSKSVVNEEHPLFAGVYSGDGSDPLTRSVIEDSDCLLMFGVMLTDMTLSFKPSRFQKRQVVYVSVDEFRVKSHTYEHVEFPCFCNALFKTTTDEVSPKQSLPKFPKKVKTTFEPKPNEKITTSRFFEKVDSILTKDMAIVADIGDSLFGAGDLRVHHRNHFLSPAYYTSMGFAIPGALGVQVAKPKVRPIVVVGDGAFQMSVTEISTIVERGLNPVIFVLNNRGYTTERFLLDGGFNDIRNWDYTAVTQLFGGGNPFVVRTEDELQEAVKFALDSSDLSVIEVQLDTLDTSPALKRMTDALSKRV